MQCYTELLPPTGVTHALAVPFLSPTARNLIVIRSSLLQVFTLLKCAQQPTEDGPGYQPTKLILEREYSLPATVTDLRRVKPLTTRSGGEAILVAVRNAKLSLIEWDPERHGISTISIHYYERDDLTLSPWAHDLGSCGSILSVDPSSRCAVFNFGIRNLAILPFHQAGDDLVMDDYDPDLDGKRPSPKEVPLAISHENGAVNQTPYAASFVLPLTALDPSLLHPVSLAFLYEYREPTFGILYSQVATSSSLLHDRKDVMFYTVFTLDLEQRASTTLLSVPRLPSDLFKVLALPPPVGGTLLIGTNEVVHVDQAGKTAAVGVNEFSRQVSSFSMSDQSDLALRLEGCVVERLGGDSGDLLLALASGDMALIRFKMDGRSVSGMTVHALPRQVGGNLLKSAASCSACFDDGNVFFGSEDADSLLLGWTHASSSARQVRKESKGVNSEDVFDDDEVDEDVYEDDLYSSVPEPSPVNGRTTEDHTMFEFYHFQINDRLPSIGPLRDITLGQAGPLTESEQPQVNGVTAPLELVAAHGSHKAGGVAVIKREIDPLTTMSTTIEDADAVWSVTVNSGKSNTTEETSSRHLVIISRPIGADKERSEALEVDGQELKPLQAPEFNPNEDCTIDVGVLASGTRLIQVLRNEIRSYDMSKCEQTSAGPELTWMLSRLGIGPDLSHLGRRHRRGAPCCKRKLC